jgi:hypothetical protein
MEKKDITIKDLCISNPNLLMSMVIKESEKQIEKWGIQDHDPFAWLAFATEELGEVSKAISEWKYRGGSSGDIVKEAVQTSTLCLKILEMFIDVRLKENE